MRTHHIPVSRRGFIGGTMTAAVGGFAAGLGEANARAFGGQSLTPALSLDAIKPTGQLDEAYWWKVRSQFNVVDGLTYMNNGTLGPMPRVVFDANERYMREIMEDPTNSGRAEEIDKVREKVAQFVGATADEIALTRSTTEGMNVFAHGFNWKAGDEVLYCTHEHGGGTGPYKTLEKRVGMKIVTVEIPSPPQSVDQIVGLFEKAITPRTKVIMVSHVTYVTGLVTPVKELADLAHRRGLLISVDGAHPLGLMDLDLHALGVDHYAAAGQKWLMCGTGTGVCYVKRDVQDRIWEAHGSAGRSQARRAEVRGIRSARRAVGAGDGRGDRSSARDRQEEHRGARPRAEHAAAQWPERHSRREAVDLERPGAEHGPHAVLGARHPDGQRPEGDHEPRPRLHPDDGDRQFERLPGGDTHLQHA